MKFKFNSKVVITLLIVSITFIVGYGINFCFYKPTKINAYIARNLYKTPANTAFVDDNFYKCVVDAYNKKNKTSVAYTENLTENTY